MSGFEPVAVYAVRVPPGEIPIPGVPGFRVMYRVTMAAIDPFAEPEMDGHPLDHPCSTLRVIRLSKESTADLEEFDDDDLDDLDDDDDDLEDDEENDDEELNGGPSTKLKVNGIEVDDDEDMDGLENDDDDEADAAAIARLTKLMKASKGKNKALDDALNSEEDDEDDLEGSDESDETDEVILCTLDPETHHQQPLDFVVNPGERVYFKVTGTHWVHLTGNYMLSTEDGRPSPHDDSSDEEDDDYDLEPTEEELAEMAEMGLLEDEDDESDELDDLAEPRLTEVLSEEEAVLETVKPAKGKNKRPADDSEEDSHANLDDIIASTLKGTGQAQTADEPPKKLSKAEKKRLKKLKANDGQAVEVAVTETKATIPDSKKKKKDSSQPNGAGSSSGGSDKKVQFAENLEQGPTPSANPPGSGKADKNKDKSKTKTEPSGSSSTTATTTAQPGVRNVNGVLIDERKVGSGATAKKGSKLEMRYIGKLDDGKVFDSNKSGKPFSFKLGAGEVIQGWDTGLTGIQPGGERRITIPPHLAYGNKALPGIPKNSKLIFDIKCLSVS